MLWRVRKLSRVLLRLARENPVGLVAAYAMSSLAGDRTPMRVRVGGRSVYVRPGTTDVTVAGVTFGGEFRTLSHAFDRDVSGLILDAGGYIGTAAVVLSEMYPNATVVTIEPSTDNIAVLRRNIADHPRVHAIQAALTPDEAGDAEVTLRNRGTGEWGFTVVEKPADRDLGAIETVAAVTVDQILKQFGFDDVLVLKMDIEGGEHALLTRPDWLAKVRVLMVELHERIVPGCVDAFFTACAGRYCYKDAGEKHVSVGPAYFNRPVRLKEAA